MAGADLPDDPFDADGWPTERLLTALPALDATASAYREHVARVVDALRTRRISWARIAEPLGITRQSAWDRFS
ncbi:MAG: hypothetical protein AAF366_20910 [Pseudomonadota bacterium]